MCTSVFELVFRETLVSAVRIPAQRAEAPSTNRESGTGVILQRIYGGPDAVGPVIRDQGADPAITSQSSRGRPGTSSRGTSL